EGGLEGHHRLARLQGGPHLLGDLDHRLAACHSFAAVRFPLTRQLLEESRRYQLRSACGDCRYQVSSDGSCALGWPNEEQRRWPLEAPDPAGRRPAEVQFCKEFELV